MIRKSTPILINALSFNDDIYQVFDLVVKGKMLLVEIGSKTGFTIN